MITKIPLTGYQLEAIEASLPFDGFAFYFKQGTGKTATAIGLVHHRKPNRLLIVAPVSVLESWVTELKKFAAFDYVLIKMDDFGPQQRAKFFDKTKSTKLTIVLTSYASVVHRFYWLRKWKPDMIIADESQNIKNPRAKQTKLMIKLGDRARYKVLLSGTPFDESGLDVYSQYRFACPEVFGKKIGEFRRVFARKKGYGYTKWVIRKGSQNLLRKKIHTRMVRVEKEDVLDLPPMKHIKAIFSLEPEVRAVYNAMEADAIASFGDKTSFSPVVVSQLIRLSQMTGGHFVDDKGGISRLSYAKTDRCRVLLRRHKDEKIVIFCRFLPEVEAVRSLVEEEGRQCFVLTGRTKKRYRYDILNAFKESKRCAVFVTQIRVGGVGINQLACASVGIFYSTTYSWIDFDQAIDRLHRYGQTRPVTFYHLLAKETVDMDIYATVRNKKQNTQVILSMKRRNT